MMVFRDALVKADGGLVKPEKELDVRGSMLVFRGALVKADGGLVKPEKELDVRGSLLVFRGALVKADGGLGKPKKELDVKIFLQLRIGGCLHDEKVLIQAGELLNEEGSPRGWPRA